VKAATAVAAGHAAAVLSPHLAALTEGVPKAMWIKTFKMVTAVLLVLGLIASGGRWLTYQTAAAPHTETVFQQGKDTKGDPDKPRNEKPAQDKANKLVTKETQQAIDSGLAYLAAQQAADGSWGNNAFRGNLGITGLAGRAFLAGGYRPGKGKYGQNLTKAI